jgi:hypothetical protein
MKNLGCMKLEILHAFRQSCIDSLLDIANLIRTETDDDNRYALEVRRTELLRLLQGVDTEIAKRAEKS